MKSPARHLRHRIFKFSYCSLQLALQKPPLRSAQQLASLHAYPYKTARAPPASSTTVRVDTNRALNPPPTSRPPALILPDKSRAESDFKYYFKVGKAYLTFYKNGLKGVYSSYKIAKAISSPVFHPLFVSRNALYAAAMAKELSRADLQLLTRLRADAKVLPFFAIVFFCCGEFTPLLVPWLTAIIPPSMHIPSQTKALRDRSERLREQARAEGPPEWRNIRNIWGIMPQNMDDGAPSRRLAIELGLYSLWWKRIPWGLDLTLVQRRLIRHLKDLQYDDLTIMRDGGVKDMIADEVAMACDRRGLTVQNKHDKEVRKMLEEWLSDRNTKRPQELVESVRGRKWDDWIDTCNPKVQR